MKKFNKIMGLMVLGISSLWLTSGVKAETTWEDLKSCLEQTQKATCEVDTALTGYSLNANLEVKGSKTLNLNGNKLTLNGYYINVEAGADLTIENGTIERTDKSLNVLVAAGGSLNLNKATLTGINDKDYDKLVTI